MKRAKWIPKIIGFAVLAIGITRFIGVLAAPNTQIHDPSIYLPIVIKQGPPAPTPTPTNTAISTSTLTLTSTPTRTNTASPTSNPSLTFTPTRTNTASPTSTLNPTPTQTPTLPLALDGSWTGVAITNGYPDQPQPVAFTVEGGGRHIATGARIDTYIYMVSPMYICSGSIQWTTGSPINIAADGSFHFFAWVGIHNFTWDGDFVALDKAEGTFHVEYLSSYCGSIVHNGTWSANWQVGQ